MRLIKVNFPGTLAGWNWHFELGLLTLNANNLIASFSDYAVNYNSLSWLKILMALKLSMSHIN